MEKALVLGGTRFFGIHLVEALLQRGVDVTVATRGETSDPFGDRVSRIKIDRSNLDAYKEELQATKWDVVYDQICYSSEDAMEAIEVFSGVTDRYILTSTLSVYDGKPTALKEEDFDPYAYEIIRGDREAFSYQEGKRQAEAVFFQRAPFEVVAVRIPIVMGINDYTERLLFHVNKVSQKQEIFFTNLSSAMNFIPETEAGDFLAWMGQTDFTGPINACSNGSITLRELLSLIEESTGNKAVLAATQDEKNESPYNVPSSWTMDNQKAKSIGYPFKELRSWLPSLIDTIAVK
ncbi:NAD-dependent epimerase/dehydratase family protein [Radiobacillus sp. PE A8.2]|uniref:NAD-dependent epimerase/dehydratase family protein n=1 Tax=Radiobacillus sp. PE A8.2 TaxID=3380349 RepID=UPI00388EA6EA